MSRRCHLRLAPICKSPKVRKSGDKLMNAAVSAKVWCAWALSIPCMCWTDAEYDLQEVAYHTGDRRDCWVVSHGKVYNAGAYLRANSHPGGAAIIKLSAGACDRAACFDSHSERARQQWDQYCIGTVAPSRAAEQPRAAS
ncbi:Cytochrome b5 isoform A [Diplonema papillatum]|nr:Cytochrome b5 isoform A [Diplonema papillatum]